MGERAFECFGVAGEDVGNAIEAIEVEGVEEADFRFVEEPVAELVEVKEIRPANAGAVVPGLAELERGTAGEKQAQNVFVLGEGAGGVDGCVVFDLIGIEAEIESEADSFGSFGAYCSLHHVFGGVLQEVWGFVEHGAGFGFVTSQAEGEELLYIAQMGGRGVGLLEQLRDLEMASGHGVLPG